MKIKHLLFALVGLLLLLYFCDRDNSINGLKIPVGAYAYTGYDSTGVKILTGWIKIIFDDSIHLSGEWELDEIGKPKNIGPQVGSGILLGSNDHGRVSFDLNPIYKDNNVILVGSYNEMKIEGQWRYVGFPGIINQGTFKAKKFIFGDCLYEKH